MIPLARNIINLSAVVLANRGFPGGENRDMSDTLESIRTNLNTLVIGTALGALPSILISDVADRLAAAAVNRWHRSRVPHVPYLEPPPQSPSY